MTKTWEIVIRGKSKKPVAVEIPNIRGKMELKLLRVAFKEARTQFDLLLQKASSRLYICMPRVCKFYCFSRDELTILCNSLIVSLF